MELLVQATKGGWRILYKTENFPFSFASDLRRQDANNNRNTVGQIAYSMAYSENGCIFSKYICIWDEERRAIGNISFSVYISGKFKMYGHQIKNLLDALSAEYDQKYMVEGYVLNNQEAGTFFNKIFKRYKISFQPSTVVTGFAFGKNANDAAFIYYNDDRHLSEYLESPYQKKFTDYKQVFFVEFSLENKLENPLNVLRHNPQANLTGFKPILNPSYNIPLKPTNTRINQRVLPESEKKIVPVTLVSVKNTERKALNRLLKSYTAFKNYFWPENLP
jgi:hypothetical protein